jgi:hypothetical protein
MKLQANTLLICGIVLFALLTLFLWTTANLTHLNCCSQEWVDGASTAANRNERMQSRASAIKETAELKRQSQIYSLSCLAGALGLSIFWYAKRERL